VPQTASGDLFSQRGGALFYGFARHEFISENALSFDLNANVVVKSQNAFVFKLRKSHRNSPTPLFIFCLQPERQGGGCHHFDTSLKKQNPRSAMSISMSSISWDALAGISTQSSGSTWLGNPAPGLVAMRRPLSVAPL
jgi:hypothetical protein